MPFCAGCGVELKDDARFCTKCGRPTAPKKTGYFSASAWGILCGLAAFLALTLVREVTEQQSSDQSPTTPHLSSSVPAVPELTAVPVMPAVGQSPKGHQWFITVLASRNHSFEKSRGSPRRPPVRTGEVAEVAVGWYSTQKDCESVRSGLSEVEIALLGTLAEEGLPDHPGPVRTACVSEMDQAWAKWSPHALVGVLGLQARETVGHFVCRSLEEAVAGKETDPVWGTYTTQTQCNKYMKQQTQALLSAGQMAGQTYSRDLYHCFYCVQGTDPSLAVK